MCCLCSLSRAIAALEFQVQLKVPFQCQRCLYVTEGEKFHSLVALFVQFLHLAPRLAQIYILSACFPISSNQHISCSMIGPGGVHI